LLSFHLRFDEGRDFFSERVERRLFAPADATTPVEPELEDSDLLEDPPSGWFLPLPGHLDEGRELNALSRRLSEEILSTEVDRLWKHATLKLLSRGGEGREAFQARVSAAAQDRADQECAKVKDKLEARLARLLEKQQKLEADRGRLEADERSRKAAEVVGVGEQLLGLFFGRRASLGSALSRRDSTRRAGERVDKVDEALAALESEVEALRRELTAELTEIQERWAQVAGQVEEQPVRLDRADLRAEAPTLLWLPVGRGLGR
jgi:DNA repair exonuclease SbcCD ATPase subunit